MEGTRNPLRKPRGDEEDSGGHEVPCRATSSEAALSVRSVSLGRGVGDGPGQASRTQAAGRTPAQARRRDPRP